MLRAMIAKEPELAERFKNSEFAFEPRTLKNWSVTTDTFYGNGFVLTGNVTEFLDPVFSSGVTLATVSAQKAANLVVQHLKGKKVDWEKDYHEPMMQGISVFRTYVNAWYDTSIFRVFFADEKDEKVKAKICSVLAGYVWDMDNPFVKNHEKSLQSLINFIGLSQAAG
jgi:flavin-dependent dehydrogenase